MSASISLAQPAAIAPHRWSSITYPRFPVSERQGIAPIVILQDGKEEGLRLDLIFFVPGLPDAPQIELPREAELVRLHLINGQIVDPFPKGSRNGGGFGNARGMSYDHIYYFPWGRNAFDEAWIEMRLAEQTYWIEIPYGFLRNPRDAMISSEPTNGRPALAIAMKQMGDTAHILSPLYVEYDLGEIQNHWRLTVQLANPFDARAELVLYRDDGAVGKSMFLWELQKPQTSIEINQPPSRTLTARAMSVRLHEDGMRRSDTFKFNRNSSRDETRHWGTATVKVDDQSYSFTVPSSLFKYVHGMADPYHKARIQSPAPANP